MQVGSTVLLRWLTPESSDPALYTLRNIDGQGFESPQVITPNSPVGRALAGAMVGSVVAFRLPGEISGSIEVLQLVERDTACGTAGGDARSDGAA